MIDVCKRDQVLELTWVDSEVQKPMLDVYCRPTFGMETLTESEGFSRNKKDIFGKSS